MVCSPGQSADHVRGNARDTLTCGDDRHVRERVEIEPRTRGTQARRNAAVRRVPREPRSPWVTRSVERPDRHRPIFVPGPQQHCGRYEAEDEEQQPTPCRHAVDDDERDAGKREPDANQGPAPV